uniref:Uncharacterized protein n=1 Tax=Knipowitschia caucasica TaxID=637954 RepID=A0AAV2LMQ0_KNICA
MAVCRMLQDRHRWMGPDGREDDSMSVGLSVSALSGTQEALIPITCTSSLPATARGPSTLTDTSYSGRGSGKSVSVSSRIYTTLLMSTYALDNAELSPLRTGANLHQWIVQSTLHHAATRISHGHLGTIMWRVVGSRL